jgi:hypothetical protein
MRVAVVTTGQMERLALASALQRLFPDHVFETLERIPGMPFDGFTSVTVRPVNASDRPGAAANLIRAALGALVPETTTTKPVDHVVILDDLELVNSGNESVVIEHLRASARRVIADLRAPADEAKVSLLLQTRVSFHLAAPMPESWFFGDLEALKTELDPDRPPPMLHPGRDPEQFLTNDPAYVADDGSACRGPLPGRRPRRVPWLVPRREEHPKLYLCWLLRDPAAENCHWYKETQEGVRLLNSLQWSTVLEDPEAFTFLRALVRDLEGVLGPASDTIPAGGAEAHWTALSTPRADPVLRNL